MERKRGKKRERKKLKEGVGIHIFPADPKVYYKGNNLLTIEINKKPYTATVNEWLKNSPTILHKTIQENELKVDQEVFSILVSKLRANHHEYFKNFLGLNMRIDFNGDGSFIRAIVPYKNKPVLFYKWWCVNKNKVKLSFKEKIELFNKVNLMDPSVLKQKHRKMLGS